MSQPPASMRGKGSTGGTSGNRSPPNYRGAGPDQPPGAMRSWSPNSGMSSSASRSPPKGMATAKDRMDLDAERSVPRFATSGRKYPLGYSGNK